MSEKKLKSVDIWRSYKQERGCLILMRSYKSTFSEFNIPKIIKIGHFLTELFKK